MASLSAANIRLMNEAIRRYCLFHAGESLDFAWIGLGTKSEYRPALDAGLMTFHDGREPYKRCMGWLVLTKKGQTEFLKMLANLIKNSYIPENFVNQYELIS